MNIEYSTDVALRQMNGSRSPQTPRRGPRRQITLRVYQSRLVEATSCGDTSQRQIALCVLENFCDNLSLCNRILSQQQVAQILSDLIFCDLFSSGTKFNYVADFHQNSLAHTKRFLAATCRRNVLLQLVA